MNENIMNNENVEVAAEVIKATTGEKAVVGALFAFAGIGVGFAVSKAVGFGKQMYAKYQSKKPAKTVETAVSDVADAIEGKFEDIKEHLDK